MNNDRGAALVIALTIVVVLSVLGTGFVVRTITENRVAQKHASSTQAFWLADAGVQMATWQMTSNSCAGFVQCGTANVCTSCTSCGAGDKCLTGTLGSNGDYDVTLNNTNTLITSTGSYPSRTALNRVRRNVQVTVSGGALFSHAVFAQNSISLSNNVTTDSYDSSAGIYGGANVGANGSIGTNGTGAGTVAIGANVSVQGNASTGAGGTVTAGANSTISGSTTHANNVTLSSVTVPSALTGLTDSGTISTTTTISTGDYKYSSVNLSNNKTLTINGNVRMYLTGASAFSTGNNVTLNISAGSSLTVYSNGVINFDNNSVINNVSKKPDKFLIYSAYTGANGVLISNNGSIYSAIYAPETNIAISNNASLFGSVVGKTVSASNNASLHYDQALSAIPGGGGYSTSSWQEL